MTDMAKPVALETVDIVRPPIKIFRHAAAKIATTPMMATVIFIFIGCTIWTIVYSLTTSRVLPASDPFGKRPDRFCTVCAGYEAQRNRIDPDIGQNTRKGLAIRCAEPEAMRRGGIGEDKIQPRSTMIEIIQRLPVGFAGIGMIDALHDCPRRLSRPSNLDTGASRIKWRDGDAI